MPDPENPPVVAQPTPAPADVSVIDAKGNFAENWADKYPEEDRPTLSRFKKFDELVTSHMSVRRKFGKDPDSLVEIPGDDSSDEVKAEFHRRRGVPEKVEDYKFTKSLDLSENIDINDAQVAAFTQIAKKHDLTQKQFLGITNDYLAVVDKDIGVFDDAQKERVEIARQQGITALKKEFGTGAEDRTLRAESLFDYYGSKVIKEPDGKTEKAIAQKLEEEIPAIKTSPWLRMIFDAIAEDMSEDRIRRVRGITTATPEALDGKIAELRKHPGYGDSSHPDHKRVNAEVQELYKRRYPE